LTPAGVETQKSEITMFCVGLQAASSVRHSQATIRAGGEQGLLRQFSQLLSNRETRLVAVLGGSLMATKSQKSPKSAKSVTPTEATFTPGEIFHGTQTARRLSRDPSSDRPGLSVEWAPAMCSGIDPSPNFGKRFEVEVELFDDALSFAVYENGKKPLQEQIAEGLDKVASYLRECIAGLDCDASHNRTVAKYTAK
jgi:hypothetical protein